jgi:hypothetical protein
VIIEPVLGSQDRDEQGDESNLQMSMLLLVSYVADYFEGRLTKEWTAPIYAFFLHTPVIEVAVATPFCVQLLKAVGIMFRGSLIREMKN